MADGGASRCHHCPFGVIVGVVPNVLGDDGGRSIAAGGLIGLLITVGMVSFEVSWAVDLDQYMDDFGVVPSIWASLHIGPVVTGEIGKFKHEIAYLGDTLNTSARIEQACRQFQRPFLASADMVDALELPSETEAESLGPIELHGLSSPMELFAITRAR